VDFNKASVALCTLGVVQWDNATVCLMGRPKVGNSSVLLLWRLGGRVWLSLSPNQPHVGLTHFYFKKYLLVFAVRCGDSDFTPLCKETQRCNASCQNLLL